MSFEGAVTENDVAMRRSNEIGMESSSLSAAVEFIDLWKTGRCDATAHADLRRLLDRCELSGRMFSGFSHDPAFGKRLTTDVRKRLSFIFGPDALIAFLGKGPREICLQLGLGAEWLDAKLKQGAMFKLAIFPSSSVHSTLANWDGVSNFVELYYPEVWPKVSAHLPSIRATPFAEIESEAGYDMLKVHLLGRDLITGDGKDPRYVSLKRLVELEGTRVEVRQFLWDEIGINNLYSGDGKTVDDFGTTGPSEYLAKSTLISDIEGCVVLDVHPV